MTRTLYDLGSDADVLFVHSARTPADIIFRQELEAIAAVMPNIRVVHVCEGDYPSERWMGLRGRLSTPMLQAFVPDLAERETYTCGPAAYMAAVRGILGEVGYDMRKYHEESFSFERLPPESSAPSMGAGNVEASPPGGTENTSYSVEFVRSGRSVTCGADEFVLDAALAAGLRLAVVLHPGHVRVLQDNHAVRRSGHAAQRWHTSSGSCAEQDPRLLFEAAAATCASTVDQAS